MKPRSASPWKHLLLGSLVPLALLACIHWFYGGYFFAFSAPVLLCAMTLSALFTDQTSLLKAYLRSLILVAPSILFVCLSFFSPVLIVVLLVLLGIHTLIGLSLPSRLWRLVICIVSVLLSGIFVWRVPILEAFVPLRFGIEGAFASTSGLGEMSLSAALVRLVLLGVFFLILFRLSHPDKK